MEGNLLRDRPDEVPNKNPARSFRVASRVNPTCALFMLISGKPGIRAQIASFSFANNLIRAIVSTQGHSAGLPKPPTRLQLSGRVIERPRATGQAFGVNL
jgi:hypothetical protein